MTTSHIWDKESVEYTLGGKKRYVGKNASIFNIMQSAVIFSGTYNLWRGYLDNLQLENLFNDRVIYNITLESDSAPSLDTS